MKTNRITALLSLSGVLALSAGAQIVPPFPAGIDTFGSASYNNTTLWAQNDANSLGDLYFDSEGTESSVVSSWASGPINLAAALGSNPWLPTGGSVQVIFLGETAGWENDFGYITSSSPAVYNPLITNIENSKDNNVAGANIASGEVTTVNYSAGQTLDFFLNSGGNPADNQGGMFFAFSSNNLFAGSDVTSNVKWTTRDVETTYFNGTSVVTNNVKTLLVGFEDVRDGVWFGDNDANDLVMAFQFLPTQPNPVPEPSTYGLIGAVALMGLVIRRRMVAKKA